MKFNHRPILDVDLIEKHYTEKDGVPVKYVCTTALGSEEFAGDIFYRSTPHPEFGNRYFGLSKGYVYPDGGFVIYNADKVEELLFDMIEYRDEFYYSQHRHDMVLVYDTAIDGGRAYTKTIGNPFLAQFKVKDGEFVLV